MIDTNSREFTRTGEGGGGENPPKANSHKPFGAWRKWIAAKLPVWRFTILLAVGLAVFYAGYALLSASEYFVSVLQLTASASAAVLGAMGHEAHVDGAVVSGPAFAFRVVRGCDGLEPIGFLLAATLATPASIGARFLFAVVGTGFLVTLNLARLVSLALMDVYFPSLTDTMHWEAWPAVTIVIVVLLWLFWVRRLGLAGHAGR